MPVVYHLTSSQNKSVYFIEGCMVEGGFFLLLLIQQNEQKQVCQLHSNSRVSFVLAVVLSAGMKNKWLNKPSLFPQPPWQTQHSLQSNRSLPVVYFQCLAPWSPAVIWIASDKVALQAVRRSPPVFINFVNWIITRGHHIIESTS